MTFEPVVAKPGGVIRFGVEDGNKRSSQYRVWGNRNAKDVYVAGRDAAEWMKASLHESGIWNHGYTSKAEGQGLLADNGRRHFEQWKRPSETSPALPMPCGSWYQ